MCDKEVCSTRSLDSLYCLKSFREPLLFTSTHFSEGRVSWGQIVQAPIINKGKVQIALNRLFREGAVFVVKGNKNLEFVIDKKLSNGRGKFLYYISLINGNKLLSLHLDALKKGSFVKVVKTLNRRCR